MFLVVLGLCGVAASFCLSWVGLMVIGLVASPLYTIAMIRSGASTTGAVVYALAGFGLLQVGFVLNGFVSGLATRTDDRPGSGGLAVPERGVLGPDKTCPSRRGSGQPGLLGSYLPLITTRRPPCRVDGGAWDGVEDPGYRIRMLVLAWRGRGVSVAIGRPYPVGIVPSMRVSAALVVTDRATASDTLPSYRGATSDPTRIKGDG
ncbi:hypothetical protein [uncultured Enterovirga sp.]|uniref:hypothetical protein n=1 Tax=uncultured Enterovirga sp. TaxID=2026352 RepID=UPI0035C94BB1